MILNTFAILDAAIAILRLPLALLVIGLGIRCWRNHRVTCAMADATTLENDHYLLSLVALLLLGLNLLAWPLLYLLLESYVAEWPGVMCIYGVTHVGAGSVGISRFLPGLLTTLQVIKPFVVFSGGAWLVLYWLNRHTATAPLLGRIFIALIVCGLLSATDATAELTYLVIPKKEEVLSTGCCTGAFAMDAGDTETLLDKIRADVPAAGFYYGSSLTMVAALLGCTWRSRAAAMGFALAPLLAGAMVTLAAFGIFLVDAAAPTVLHLPFHHCAYDLIPGAPELLVGVASFFLGTFAVGWACVAGWCGRSRSTEPFLSHMVGKLLFAALCGYVGALVLMASALAVA